MKLLASKKGKILIGAIAFALIAIGVILAIVFSRGKYRSISVADVRGNTQVVGKKNNGSAYKGQRFYGGDDVTVMEDSDLTMCIDQTKYLYANQNTHFHIENTSTRNASRIRIVLDKGSELNELKEKLGADESYQVDTPNSTMSVRGTKFRVTVDTDENGVVYTLVEVEEGVVFVECKNLNGEYNGVSQEFYPGQSCVIRADGNTSEILTNAGGDNILTLNYNSLPTEHVERLRALLVELDSSGGKTKEEAQQTDDGNKAHTHMMGAYEVTVEPGCDTKGKQVAKCTECGEVMEEEELPALGHKFSKWKTVKDATCTEEGTESRTCERCNQTEKRTIAIKEHQWSEWKTTSAPNCVNQGSEERTCAVGGEKETRTVPATGTHNFSNYVVDKEATCDADGSAHYSCSVCGATGSSEVIPKKTHDYEEVGTEPIDSTKYKVNYKCKYCGQTYSATKYY